MRFALLCDDPSVRPLIDAFRARVDGHELTRAARPTAQADQLLRGCESVSIVQGWVDLLVAKDIDAVLVGGSHEQILEGAKQLATAGIPVLFAPQSAQGSTFAYELSLVRDDNRVPLFPVFMHRFDHAANSLKTTLDEGQIGRVQFLQLHRTVSSGSAGAPIPQSVVDSKLLDDVDLLRWLVGDYDQVTGLRTAATDQGVLAQSVVLAGRSLPEANWSIAPATGPNEWRLTVRGEQGSVELIREGDSPNWVFIKDGQRVEGNVGETSRALLNAFATSVANDSANPELAAKSSGREWGELVKCFETLDATHRSVRRKRTIELHFEPMSERAIFKTQMTAIGCGLLIATLFLMLGYLGIASVIPLPQNVLVVLRVFVFGPLIIFLIAQLLLPLTRPSTDETVRL